jgi:hypothetical protein
MIAPATTNLQAAQLQQRVRQVKKLVANRGNKMNSNGLYEPWTPFYMLVDLKGARTSWSAMAKIADPHLERDIEAYLNGGLSSHSTQGQRLKQETDSSGDEMNSHNQEADRKVYNAPTLRDPLRDPLDGIVRKTMPKGLAELKKYAESLSKTKSTMKAQLKVVQATLVQVEYKKAMYDN